MLRDSTDTTPAVVDQVREGLVLGGSALSRREEQNINQFARGTVDRVVISEGDR